MNTSKKIKHYSFNHEHVTTLPKLSNSLFRIAGITALFLVLLGSNQLDAMEPEEFKTNQAQARFLPKQNAEFLSLFKTINPLVDRVAKDCDNTSADDLFDTIKYLEEQQCSPDLSVQILKLGLATSGQSFLDIKEDLGSYRNILQLVCGDTASWNKSSDVWNYNRVKIILQAAGRSYIWQLISQRNVQLDNKSALDMACVTGNIGAVMALLETSEKLDMKEDLLSMKIRGGKTALEITRAYLISKLVWEANDQIAQKKQDENIIESSSKAAARQRNGLLIQKYNQIIEILKKAKSTEIGSKYKGVGIKYKVQTSQGKIAVWDSQGTGHPVLFIHGNSAFGDVFKKQFNSSALNEKYRLIAPDLPGHGDSDVAANTGTYSFPGYARVLAEMIKELGLDKVTIVGWSLGGHIALELSQMLPEKISGILITGTPPIALSPEGIGKGFKPIEGLHLLGHEPQFTKQEATFFMKLGGFDVDTEEGKFLIESGMKTQGAARKFMFESIGKGVGEDETKIVASMKMPLAIVAGELDKGINNEYIMNDVTYSSLWNNKVNIIKNAGHAVFWETAEEFNEILRKFLDYVYSQKKDKKI